MKPLKVNIHHNNMHCKNVYDLFLLCRLRMFAAEHGGSFKGAPMSGSDSNHILRRLVKRGWVTKKGKVVKYRTIIFKENCANAYTMLDAKYLTDINTFKGWLLAVAETYCLNRKHAVNTGKIKKTTRDGSKDKVNWSNLGVRAHTAALLETKKIGFGDASLITGRCFNDELVRLMGISERTVTNWRSKAKINIYEYKNILYKEGGSNAAMNAVWAERVENRSVFRSARHDGLLVSIDMIVTSEIHIFKFKLKNKKRK
jgi:uncharacterized protein (UPF0297 family)